MKALKKKLVLIFVIVVFLFLCAYKSIGFTYVIGKSMESTFEDGDLLLVSKLYSEEDIKRGDVVILDVNYEGKKTRIIKRIIGKSGDELEIRDNKLYINNIKIQELYIKEEMHYKNEKFIIPKGYIFIMGDNRNISLDSRNKKIGYINFEESIYGKVVFGINRLKCM